MQGSTYIWEKDISNAVKTLVVECMQEFFETCWYLVIFVAVIVFFFSEPVCVPRISARVL